MPKRTFPIDTPAKRVLLLALAVASVIAAGLIMKWSLGNTISARSEHVEVADLAAGLAPSDPQSHFAAGILRERTLEPADAELALREFETAAGLSPNNYLIWLAVARVREASGDRGGAETALRRARDLAPNYSRVRWAYGNVLLRQGKPDEAFAEMRAAAAADPAYAQPLIAAADQFYDGDALLVREAAGDTPAVASALSLRSASEGKFDEALEVWRELGPDQKTAAAATGMAVLNKMIEAKKYVPAAELANILVGSSRYEVGAIYDGGFENGISMQNAGPFGWRIADGPQPQVALTDGQRHSGAYSLLMIFRGAAGGDLRSISQTIAAVPGQRYALEGFYRSDLKSQARIKWQIAAPDGRVIGSTDPFASSSDWAQFFSEFSVPPDSDGVTIALVRDACPAPCTIAGNLWFDDVSVRAVR